MNNILKNIFCLFIINLIASMGYFVLSIFVFGMMMSESSLMFNVSLVTMLTIIFARLFVLPIAYKKLEKSQDFELVAKFIQKIKYSFYLKIIVLIFAYIFDIIICLIIFRDIKYAFNIADILVQSLFFCYIVLFIYWFIEDKIKKIKDKKHINNIAD